MKAFNKNSQKKIKIYILERSYKFLYAIFFAALVSCSNEPLIDVRVAEQQAFVRVVKEVRDQTERVALTDPNRPVMIDVAVKRVKAYIADTLKSEFKGWDVRVLDNIKTDPNGNEIRITFGTSIDDFNLEETARYKSIVFREWLSDAQPQLRERLEALTVGDHVKISGSFVIRDKQINVDPYNVKEFRQSKNIFSNPEFRVDVTEVLIVED
jgi:hypothetical protein